MLCRHAARKERPHCRGLLRECLGDVTSILNNPFLLFPFFYLTQKEEALATSEIYGSLMWLQGFPGGSVVKNPPANAGDTQMWV